MLADSGPSCEARFLVILSLAWRFRANTSDIVIPCDLALRGTPRSLGWWQPLELRSAESRLKTAVYADEPFGRSR